MTTISNVSARDRYLSLIERHEVAWELGFAALAIVYVIVGFVEETPAIAAIELALTVAFVAEFVSRFSAAYDRRAYLRSHWIDLVALVPTTRALRLLRLLRRCASSARLPASIEPQCTPPHSP